MQSIAEMKHAISHLTALIELQSKYSHWFLFNLSKNTQANQKKKEGEEERKETESTIKGFGLKKYKWRVVSCEDETDKHISLIW